MTNIKNQNEDFEHDEPTEANCVRLDIRTAAALRQVVAAMDNHEYPKAYRMLKKIQIDGRLFADWGQ